MRRTLAAAQGHSGVSVGLLCTTYIAQPAVKEITSAAHAASLQEGSKMAVQKVNDATSDAAARGARVISLLDLNSCLPSICSLFDSGIHFDGW